MKKRLFALCERIDEAVEILEGKTVKKLLIAAAILCVAPAAANASGWVAEYDCGDGVVATFGGWHGKTWLTVEGNHKIIREEELFKDVGIASRQGDDGNPVYDKPFNADKTDFRFRIKWHGKTQFIHWHATDAGSTVADEISLNGKVCHDMGDPRYDNTEAYKYEEKNK